MEELNYCYKYPHAALTTDAVVFGFDGAKLNVLLIERGGEPCKGCWALPGGFLNMDETVEEGALRELKEETGVENLYLEQFHVYSTVDRDPRERVITVAFLALVKKADYQVIAGDDAAKAEWFDVEELPALAFDHKEIIRDARIRLREQMSAKPLAFSLLDERFTIREIQTLFETVNGIVYDRRNFYRKLLATGFLKECGLSPEPTPNKRPQLFSFDRKAYEEEQKNGSGRRFPFDF